jgi:hypothetical protein
LSSYAFVVFCHLEHYMQALRRLSQHVLDNLILTPPPVSAWEGLTNMRIDNGNKGAKVCQRCCINYAKPAVP